MEPVESLLSAASDRVWGPPMLILLMGTHLFLTIRLRFIQRFLGRAIKLSFQRTAEGESPTSSRSWP